MSTQEPGLDLPMSPEPAPQVPAQPAVTPEISPSSEPEDPNEITGMRPLGSFNQTPVPPADKTAGQPATTPVQPATPAEAQPQTQVAVPPETNATVRLSNSDELEGLEISQSSISTGEQDNNEISQHLNKVYTPSNDNIVQYGDEDRMPTILFDDEMAKELEKTTRQNNANPSTDGTDNPPEPGSIKISK